MITMSGNYSKIGSRLAALKAEMNRQIRASLEKVGPILEESNRQSIMKSKDPEGKDFEPIRYPFRPSKRPDGAIIMGQTGTPGIVLTKPGDKPLLNHGALQRSLSWSVVSLGSNFTLKIGAYSSKQAQKLKKHHNGTAGEALHLTYYHGVPMLFYKDIKPYPRKVLGFSNWARYSGVNDIEVVKNEFKKTTGLSISLTRVT